MKQTIGLLWAALAIAGCCAQTNSPANAQPAPADQSIPVLDGGAGPCSAEFTVTTADGKPAAAAKVKVHIAYRFGGLHKLDLEASTNSDGKVKFTGLPSRVRRSELEFAATKDDSVGAARVDPAKECQAKREIKLEKQSAGAKQP